MTDWTSELLVALQWMERHPPDSVIDRSWVKLTHKAAKGLYDHINELELQQSRHRSFLRLLMHTVMTAGKTNKELQEALSECYQIADQAMKIGLRD